MPNPYFNNFTSTNEQLLVENLVVESLQMYAHGAHYLPKTLVNFDEIYGEDSISQYNTNFFMDIYIRTYNSYQGDGVFLSKFNLEIRDTLIVCVAKRLFEQTVTDYDSNIVRPREGDLIHMPLDNRIYQITYVNKTPVFYQLGAIQFYELTLEMFEHSGEVFNTGITEIDQIYTNTNEPQDLIDDTDEIQQEANTSNIFDWTEVDPFSEGNI